MTVGGCGTEREPAVDSGIALSQNGKVSGCGGLSAAKQTTPTMPNRSASNYCDSEVLRWSCDRAMQRLALSNDRVLLNCCGDHAVSLLRNGRSCVLSETDAPQTGIGRCRCMCVFDFALTAEPIAEQSLQLKVIRQVTDEGAPRITFEGRFDLHQGSGTVVIDETSTPFCS